MGSRFLGVLLGLFSMSCLANTSNCSFPHHFTIVGPDASIKRVARLEYEANNLTVIQQDTQHFGSYQINPQECGGGAIALIVGRDPTHWAELVLVDSNTGLRLISYSWVNGYYLHKIEKEDESQITLVFRQQINFK